MRTRSVERIADVPESLHRQLPARVRWTRGRSSPNIPWMDQAAVVRELREAERAVAIGWRGAAGVERPAATLREVLQELASKENPNCEVPFTLRDRVSQILFLSLCERYGLPVIRRKGQRSTTFVARGPETFIDKIFWPLMQKQLRALVARSDAWLAGIIEECIRDDLPPERR